MAPREPDIGAVWKQYRREALKIKILFWGVLGILFFGGLMGLVIGLNNISKYIVN